MTTTIRNLSNNSPIPLSIHTDDTGMKVMFGENVLYMLPASDVPYMSMASITDPQSKIFTLSSEKKNEIYQILIQESPFDADIYTYNANVKNGWSTNVDESGFYSQIFYLNDEPQEERSFYDDGAPCSIRPFENGVLHGHAQLYREDGRLLEDIPYVHGKRQGLGRYYDQSGLITLVNWQDDCLFGVHEQRDLSGNLLVSFDFDTLNMGHFHEALYAYQNKKLTTPYHTKYYRDGMAHEVTRELMRITHMQTGSYITALIVDPDSEEAPEFYHLPTGDTRDYAFTRFRCNENGFYVRPIESLDKKELATLSNVIPGFTIN